MFDSNTYQHTTLCGNCGRPNLLIIPKGQTIAQYEKSIDCRNCGVPLRQSKYYLSEGIGGYYDQ